jgi:endonuclease/exonuclease/phosphatase family metal-dependent hydrolase
MSYRGVISGAGSLRREAAGSLTRPLRILLVLSGLALASSGAGAAEATANGAGKRKPVAVRVMTRNLYIGTDLTGVATSSSLSELYDRAGEALLNVDATRPRLRMRAVAQEILRKRPHLVGLQEVALWRTGPPDGAPFVGAPATTVRYDFLKLLLHALNGKRRNYRVVRVQAQADAEVGADTAETGDDVTELDLRLTDRDAILARVRPGAPRVRTRRSSGHHFRAAAPITVAGVSGTLPRGWVSTLVRIGRARFKLVNTHLDPIDAAIRTKQADELVRKGGPARSRRLPVVLIGDLNSDDDSVSVANRGAYRRIRRAGFRSRSTSRPSCCYQSLWLDDPNDRFDHQVDHVLVNRRRIRLRRSSVTGTVMVGGRFASDHGGVVSTLLLP